MQQQPYVLVQVDNSFVEIRHARQLHSVREPCSKRTSCRHWTGRSLQGLLVTVEVAGVPFQDRLWLELAFYQAFGSGLHGMTFLHSRTVGIWYLRHWIAHQQSSMGSSELDGVSLAYTLDLSSACCIGKANACADGGLDDLACFLGACPTTGASSSSLTHCIASLSLSSCSPEAQFSSSGGSSPRATFSFRVSSDAGLDLTT
jgi:hypothetical protein